MTEKDKVSKALHKWTRIKWFIFILYIIPFQNTDAFVPHPAGEQNENVCLPLLLGSANEDKRRFPTNFHSFRDYRINNVYYVDKTEIIQRLVTREERCLITRPRGFGKSTNLSMLDEFLNKFKNSSELFNGLKISKNAEFCQHHQNKYVVIYLDFKDIGKSTFSKVEQEIIWKVKAALKGILDKMSWQYKEMFPIELEIEIFGLTSPKSFLTVDKVFEGFQLALTELEHQNQSFVVLIDNYDIPFLHAFDLDKSPKKSKGEFAVDGFYSKTQNLMTEILLRLFRNNAASPYLGVVTGVFDLEYVISDVGNILIHSFLENEMYGSYFGFTKSEVQHLIQESGSSMSYDKLKAYYDGYHHGKSEVYNPMSVMSGLSSNNLHSYWPEQEFLPNILGIINSSGNYGLTFIQLLILGRSFIKKINPHLYYRTIAAEEETFWTLLAHSGYIDVLPIAAGYNSFNLYNVSIPNTELQKYLASNVKFPNFTIFADSLKHQNQTEFHKQLTEFYKGMGPYFTINKETSSFQHAKFLMEFIACVFPRYNITETDDIEEYSSLCTFEVEDLERPDDGEKYIFSVGSASPKTTEKQMEKILKAKIRDIRGAKPRTVKSKNATGVLIVFKGVLPHFTVIPKVCGLLGWLEWLFNYVKTKWT